MMKLKLNIEKKENIFPLFKYEKYDLSYTEEFVMKNRVTFESIEKLITSENNDTRFLSRQINDIINSNKVFKGLYTPVLQMARDLPKQWERIKKARIKKNEAITKRLLAKLEKQK